MTIGRLGLTLVAFSIAPLHSQAPVGPAFEVASIKPNRDAGGEGKKRENVTTAPGRLTMQNAGLNSCIRWAYDVEDYQIVGPDWLAVERFDIIATAEDPAPDKQLKLMFQRLLAERFKLSIHREEKPMQGYALLVAKGGPKLQESKDESVRGLKGSRKMVLAAQAASMNELAVYLSGPARGPVADLTGLKGRFDIVLDLSQIITPEAQREGGMPAAISIGLQEQLGLKLEARKVAIPMIVVDHADKTPTDNE